MFFKVAVTNVLLVNIFSISVRSRCSDSPSSVCGSFLSVTVLRTNRMSPFRPRQNKCSMVGRSANQHPSCCFDWRLDVDSSVAFLPFGHREIFLLFPSLVFSRPVLAENCCDGVGTKPVVTAQNILAENPGFRLLRRQSYCFVKVPPLYVSGLEVVDSYICEGSLSVIYFNLG